MTDREQLCKEFTELTGGHGNPSYENHADVLRVMMARDDWYILDWAKPSGFVWNIGEPILCGRYAVGYNINSRYILETDTLLEVAVTFLRAKAAKD